MFVKLLDREYSFLAENGFVYLIRKRKTTNRSVKIYYNGRKIGLGTLDIVGKVKRNCKEYYVNDEELSKFLKFSGFKSIDEWLKNIKKRCGSHLSSMILYKLEIVKFFRT